MTNRIEKSKAYIYAALAFGLLSDAVSIAVLLLGGIYPTYGLPVFLITALDVVMIVLMRFANPRVRSTIPLYVVYAAAVSGVSFWLAFLYGFYGVDRIMTTFSALIFLGCHVFAALLIALICAGSRINVEKLKKGRRTRLGAGVLLSAIVTAGFVASVFFLGFFGQGFGNRELVYNYDGASDSFVVTGLTRGRAKTVVIPETFDGKPVSAVSVSVFNDETVTGITIEKRSETLTVLFDVKATFDSLRSLKSFRCSKDDIDSIKRQFYEFGSEESFSVANMLAPNDLAEDEVFVSFALERSFTEATGDYLRTWICPKGTVFSLDFDGTTEYSVHTDPDNIEDLEWVYEHNNGVLLNGVYVGETRLDGIPINGNIEGATLRFDRVWRVIFDADNDTVYDLPQEVTRDEIGGEVKDYRYVLQSRADELYGLCDRRTGFSLRFLVGGNECLSFADYLLTHPTLQKDDGSRFGHGDRSSRRFDRFVDPGDHLRGRRFAAVRADGSDRGLHGLLSLGGRRERRFERRFRHAGTAEYPARTGGNL